MYCIEITYNVKKLAQTKKQKKRLLPPAEEHYLTYSNATATMKLTSDRDG